MPDKVKSLTHFSINICCCGGATVVAAAVVCTLHDVCDAALTSHRCCLIQTIPGTPGFSNSTTNPTIQCAPCTGGQTLAAWCAGPCHDELA